MAKKKKPQVEEKTYLWKDRKHTVFGLPWSFTKYALDEERLYITTGCFSRLKSRVMAPAQMRMSARSAIRGSSSDMVG